MSEPNNNAPAPESEPTGSKRKRVLSIIAVVFVAVGLLWAIYHFAYVVIVTCGPAYSRHQLRQVGDRAASS